MTINRREFLGASGVIGAGLFVPGEVFADKEKERPRERTVQVLHTQEGIWITLHNGIRELRHGDIFRMFEDTTGSSPTGTRTGILCAKGFSHEVCKATSRPYKYDLDDGTHTWAVDAEPLSPYSIYRSQVAKDGHWQWIDSKWEETS